MSDMILSGVVTNREAFERGLRQHQLSIASPPLVSAVSSKGRNVTCHAHDPRLTQCCGCGEFMVTGQYEDCKACGVRLCDNCSFRKANGKMLCSNK